MKIDGAFVRDLPQQPFNQAVLQALQIIAGNLKIDTVAEFVETVEEMELLRSIGISCAQGHYIGRPRYRPYGRMNSFRRSSS